MIKITSVNGYDIFEVTKGDSEYIRNMFSSSYTDVDSETTTSHDWEAWVATFMPDWFKYIFEPGLKVIESGKEEDYLSRYPYEDEISSEDKARLRHPLFVISAQKDAKYKNILFATPLVGTEAVCITDSGGYWRGDSDGEYFSDIVGDKQLANVILNEIYSYIERAESLLIETSKV